MIHLFLVGLGGGALIASLVERRKRSTLLDILDPAHLPPQGRVAKLPTDALDGLGSHLSCLDDRYQSLVQTHLDPLLVSEVREEQMRQIGSSGLRKLNDQEKANNRRLALGVAGLALLGLKSLTRWPLTPIVFTMAGHG